MVGVGIGFDRDTLIKLRSQKLHYELFREEHLGIDLDCFQFADSAPSAYRIVGITGELGNLFCVKQIREVAEHSFVIQILPYASV